MAPRRPPGISRHGKRDHSRASVGSVVVVGGPPHHFAISRFGQLRQSTTKKKLELCFP